MSAEEAAPVVEPERMKMIVHIVMFQFKEENKAENMVKAKQMLEALVDVIDPLLSMEVGINFSQSERALDMVLTSTFESVEDLGVYATHPAHLEFVAYAKETAVMTKVVDYVK